GDGGRAGRRLEYPTRSIGTSVVGHPVKISARIDDRCGQGVGADGVAERKEGRCGRGTSGDPEDLSTTERPSEGRTSVDVRSAVDGDHCGSLDILERSEDGLGIRSMRDLNDRALVTGGQGFVRRAIDVVTRSHD